MRHPRPLHPMNRVTIRITEQNGGGGLIVTDADCGTSWALTTSHSLTDCELIPIDVESLSPDGDGAD